MAETTNFTRFLQTLATAGTPSEQSALIAESAFARFSASTALVARRCSILHWFDATILAALLPESTEPEAVLTAETVREDLAQLPFVEHLPWGLAYHEQTRAGLLDRYSKEEPDMLKAAAALAAPAYQQHPNRALAGQEALFCWIVGGESDRAQQLLGDLIREFGGQGDWNGLLALFALHEQAATLPFVELLQHTAFHHFARGVAFGQLGNRAEAIAAYQQAIALDEKYAYPWNGLGNAYRDLKRDEEAIAAYQQAIALDEKYAYPWNGLGNAYGDLKRYEEAIAAYQQAIALDEKYAYPWNGLGNAYRDLKRYEEAIAAYQQAIALDEKYATPWNGLGSVYGDLKRYEEAIAAYQQAIALDEKYAIAWRNLGLAYRILKRWNEAETAFRHALTLDSASLIGWCGLADILRRRGDQAGWQQAQAQAKPLVDYNDFYNAACFESVSGNVEQALGLLTQAAAKVGFDAAWAQEDPDLEWIRHDPRFAQIIKGT